MQALLTSRIVLGELHFGELVNTDSHPAIVDVATWQTVQRMRSPRGRRAKSERLLARLGVLRCATCGARMVVGSSDQTRQRATTCTAARRSATVRAASAISADIAERVIEDEMRAWLAGASSSASVEAKLGDAVQERESAEQERDGLIEMLSGREDVDAARAKLDEADAKVAEALGAEEKLRASLAPALTLSASGDWDSLSLDGKRALILSVIETATVAPGRGADRVTVQTFSE